MPSVAEHLARLEAERLQPSRDEHTPAASTYELLDQVIDVLARALMPGWRRPA